MKSFRDQFIECRSDNVSYEKKIKKESVVEVLTGRTFEYDTVLWCSKFDKQCMSKTCKEMRSGEADGSN